MTGTDLLHHAPLILTEGAIAERLKHEFQLSVDDQINHAGCVYDAPVPLRTLYDQYIKIAVRFQLPLMLMTPTRRVNAESLRISAFAGRDVIGDCCAFLQEIRNSHQPCAVPILLGGLLGCRGNAYCADGALPEKAAVEFHRVQVAQFMNRELDFLFAGIMPVLPEAVGMARAMAASGMPYIISFMVRKDGRLLDGTPIAVAIERIDHTVHPQPVCYMANCVHPGNLKQALEQDVNRTSPYLRRFQGVQANASAQSPEELDGCRVLQQDDVSVLVSHMHDLHRDYGLRILGGCCGTDHHFLSMVARETGNG